MTGRRVVLLDYGAGNLHSLAKALEAGGARVRVTASWEEALEADALVLPGVGSFGAAAAALGDGREGIRDALAGGLPCLGICLGMQLLLDGSEEAPGRPGIGLVPGRVRRLRAPRVPHVGWNDVEAGRDPLFRGTEPLLAYYANGFVCEPDDPGVVIARTRYGETSFPAAIRAGRTWGVQFHPEKSSDPGLRLLRNFLRVVGR